MDLLKRLNMGECKPTKTPMPSTLHLNLEEGGKLLVQTLYHYSKIGTLLYLIVSKPNIIFSVCMCAEFKMIPKVAHLVAVRCLKHTPIIVL